MNHTLLMRTTLFAVLAALTAACGQKGPLVAPPDETPAAEAAPATPTTTDEADD